MILLSQAESSAVNHEAVAAYIAGGIAFAALVTSIFALVVAGRANNINISVAKRQGVIDLHFAWRDVNELDVNALIGPDVARAVRALDLTSSLWNHDVIERLILYQSYWASYQHLYETLKVCQSNVPGYDRKACQFITPEIDRAYDGMKSYALSNVKQTKV